ncbi:MAG TPA: hypothetical protein VG520_01340 [Candidatus Dormibacteraeota bacterium]|jgi:hypothetical protein|nr:hypothetical protein [Candidatus Dormibacteraeota bacterium]
MSETGAFPNKVLSDAARLLASSLGELVPPEAQLHLLNAQRELLLAIAVIIEHNSGRTPRRPRAAGTARKPATRRPKRVKLD